MPPTTTPKIEDLRARVKLDPKSRHFYPLAEELKKFGRLDEAEQVLRKGLESQASYLSAWVSLGKVLRELGKMADAVQSFKRALALDPSNVVAARQLGECYLEQGEKIEAIKKFKLVRALHPEDEEVEAHIDRLEREINPHKFGAVTPAPVVTQAPPSAAALPETEPVTMSSGVAEEERATESPSEAMSPVLPDLAEDVSTPFAAAPPLVPSMVGTTLVEGVDVDRTPGMSVFEPEIPEEESPEAQSERFEESDFGAPALAEETSQPASPIETETMAELYAGQGHSGRAIEIYERILQRDPGNEEVRARLLQLRSSSGESAGEGNRAKIARLQKWMERVATRGEPSV